MGYKESYKQWKEFYIADFRPNLSENVLEEPLENPVTHDMEFVKFSLMDAFEIGYISEYLSDRVRTAVMKANLTGESPASHLHDLVVKEIELGDRTIIGMVFGKSLPANAVKDKKGGRNMNLKFQNLLRSNFRFGRMWRCCNSQNK